MTPRADFDSRPALKPGEIIVDSFAGGGGASEGIRIALGRDPDIAINHDAEAICMHRANHPTSEHFNESVWAVDPAVACRGRRVGLFWLSPDCTDFSKAKGGKPISRKRRALAWLAVRWAKAVKPRVICLENVEEFEGWGPLLKNDKRDPSRVGLTFKMFVGRLRGLGYVVEWRQLRASDYGAPTTRKRLFVIARCDGQPIMWPKPTHGPGRPHAHRTFAECADFSLPCPSIFMTRSEAKRYYRETGIRVKRPLEIPTHRRIGRGVWRYVINDADPFIVGVGGRMGQTLERSVREPCQTMIGKNDAAIVVPTLIQTGYGERKGQAPRVLDMRQPLGTVVGQGNKHALVAAFLAKHNGGHEATGHTMHEPLHTVAGRVNQAIVTSHLLKLHGSSVQGDLFAKPAPTIRAGGNHLAEVRAFLIAYYGNEKDGQSVKQPLRAVTSKDRMALVTVHGQRYVFADIGMRMITTRERFRAQGFGDHYIIDPLFTYEYRWKKGPRKGQLIRRVTKPLTEEAQGRMVGNSVCPPLAAALVGANCRPMRVPEQGVA